MDIIDLACYPQPLNTNDVKGRIEDMALTLTRKFRRLPLTVCLSIAAVILAACGSEEPPTAAPATGPTTAPTAVSQNTPAVAAATEAPQLMLEVGHEAGQMAPDFMLATVEGENVSLETLQGRPTILYFYATW